MTFNIELLVSARRHLEAAEKLNSGKSRAVAGYLYGLAAEMAMKYAMRNSGLRPGASKKDDAFYAHFPSLKTLIIDQARGRHSGKLLRLAKNSMFMQFWDITMRYAPASDIKDEWVTMWAGQAKELVAEVDTW